jgi:N-formylmaleamate deformylase
MSNWSSGEVIANGITIHYYRTGGDRPPLVLAHGFSDNGLCWTRVTQVLEQDYDVIMPDARGHGLSDAPKDGYASEDHAAYPERVACAILEDPPWFGENSPWNRQRSDLSEEERQAQAEKRFADMVAMKAKTREEIMAFGRQQSPTWDETEFGPWADAKKQLNTNVLGRPMLTRKPWQEIASAISRPTLLLTADPDKAIVTPEIAQKAAQMNDNIRWVRIEGAGHNIRREQFEPFIQAVTEFLAHNYR